MKADMHLLYLQEKIHVLQATKEFAFQLQKARDSFDYQAALKSMGNKAIGMKYFYERSLNLINWIYVHSAFSLVLKQNKSIIHQERLEQSSSNLTSSFLLLQESALELLDKLNDSLEKLEKEYNTGGFTRNVRNWIEHKLGIDILETIVNAKPEVFWTDLFEQGFKNSAMKFFP